MAIYHQLGNIPRKRHTQFKKDNGAFFHEQLFGTEGFSGLSSLLYHHHRPTQIKKIIGAVNVQPAVAVSGNITSRCLRGFEVTPENDFLKSRNILLVNDDVKIGLAAPRQSLETYFYKNVDADELLFIHKGKGHLRTLLGSIPFGYGDYLVIPRGIIYQITFETEDNRILFLESSSSVYFPERYRNSFGQLLEHSPFCERDIVKPRDLEAYDEKGDFLVKIKKKACCIRSFMPHTHSMW